MRNLTPLDQQTVPRMQADTLYSVAIVDASKPVKLHMPDPGAVLCCKKIIKPAYQPGDETKYRSNKKWLRSV